MAQHALVVGLVVWLLAVYSYSPRPFTLFRRGRGRGLARWWSTATADDAPPTPNPLQFSTAGQSAIDEYAEELASLRGTPELVDRLENLVSRFPGVENNINLYRAIYPFKLDDFQEQGLSSIMAGNNVLVTTPTGSGKTVVGELAIYFALMLGLRVAYTTPLKALSNQKFQDFKAKYGGDRVGLLTGDIAINRGAAVTIMTTEVFRNMIYDQDSESQLSNLFMVCFDEFHFMNDPDRGTVWEESVISCPPSVRILALSATMGNVAEIKGWMQSIHGSTDLVQSSFRPVPLRYMFALKQGLMPLFRDPNAGPGSASGVRKGPDGKLDAGSSLNPTIIKMEEQVIHAAQKKQTSKTGRQFKTAKVNPNTLIPRYSDVAEELHSLKLLPAIVFIFSRAGCEQSAKLVMQTKAKLLNDEEVRYVSQAINAFAKQNPEIPITKAAVQTLRAGVGVHHAGLIPVWKAFIEDLFNANKIKVLFATETLAAGVNMPARTTVISTVTKRINSEVIKLKTSQLLQMAGRAGRRGLDTEGTVVVMRNRFEDARMGHKILTSPVDGIKSHFKTSYGLVVKLLETRSLEACKELVQRGFGAYLLNQRLQRKPSTVSASASASQGVSTVEQYRAVLQRYTLKVARDYLKVARRLEKERRNGEFLEEKLSESGSDLVQAIADYMPLGTGLQLRDGRCGFFLGDVRWGAGAGVGGLGGEKDKGKGGANIPRPPSSSPSSLSSAAEQRRINGFGVITAGTGELLVVRKEHIAQFAEPDSSLPLTRASALVPLLQSTPTWDEVLIHKSGSASASASGSSSPVLQARPSPREQLAGINEPATAHAIAEALQVVLAAPAALPDPGVPGSLVRHREIVAELERELAESEVHRQGDGPLVLDALRYAAGLRDPMGFINGAPKGDGGGGAGGGEFFAWKMFMAALQVLRQFKALEGAKATDLGQVVSSLSADNELWMAMVMLHPSVGRLQPGVRSPLPLLTFLRTYRTTSHTLSPPFLLSLPFSPQPQELAAVMCSVITDGHKAQNAFFRHGPSPPVQDAVADLEGLRQDLLMAQTDAGVDFPVNLSGEAGGMVERWCTGISWRELCKETSLDQGDVCRILRRTVEALRQIPLAYGVPQTLSDLALKAVAQMDRFPVADADADQDASAPSISSAGRGFAEGLGVADSEAEDGGSASRLQAELEAAEGDFEGEDDFGDDEDEDEEGGEGSRRGLFPWKAKGLKGDRNALQELDDLDGGLDLDTLLGLGLGLSEAEAEAEAEAGAEAGAGEEGEVEELE